MHKISFILFNCPFSGFTCRTDSEVGLVTGRFLFCRVGSWQRLVKMRNLYSDCIILPMYIRISIIKNARAMKVKCSVCTVLGNLSHWIQQALPDKSDLGFVLVDYGHVRYKVLWLLLRNFSVLGTLWDVQLL